MDLQLDAAQARVLGSLLEKEIATPEYYPLSLNALVNACNQKSNRDPVVSYGEDTVEQALEELRKKGLALRISGRDTRVPKHEQRFTEKFNLGRREAAVMCVLLLRGPQTVGELRGRTERLYPFDGLEAVAGTLDRLAEMEFVRQLPRQPGFKEQRYAHLLGGEVETPPAAESAPVAPPAAEAAPETQAAEAPPEAAAGGRASPGHERIAALETALAELRREFEEFRRKFE